MKKLYDQIADDEVIDRTVKALNNNGFTTRVAANKQEAKELTLALIPKGSEVFTNISATLSIIGVADILNGPAYISVRDRAAALPDTPDKKQKAKRLSAAPAYTVGSAHAITQDGRILIASATGSQIPAEAYGANHVILVVGAQKIVKDIEDGLRRIEEYSVPLEDKRAMAAYGIHTAFAKLLMLNKEMPGRVVVIIVKENIGF